MAVSSSAPRVNLEAMCRLCLTEDEVVLFSLRAGQVPARFEVPNPVVSKIRKLFNISVFQEGMPDKICHNCLIKVDLFYSFNTIVEAGQYKLMVLTSKSNGAENPEGSKAVDNTVVSFSKFKKYGLLCPTEVTQEELPNPVAQNNSVEQQNRTDTGMITITRPSVPDTVRVRVKPYSVPPAKAISSSGGGGGGPAVTTTTTAAAAPKLKSVALKVHDLSLLKVAKVTPPPPAPAAAVSVVVAGPSRVCEVKQEPSPCLDQFGCEVCSETFHMRRLLLNHILTHYQDNIYTCHVPSRECEAKVWFSSSEFREHLVTKHRKSRDSFVVIALNQRAEKNSRSELCVVCMASVKGSLEQHMQVAHKGYHCCRVCSKWFTSARALHIHAALHDGGQLD